MLYLKRSKENENKKTSTQHGKTLQEAYEQDRQHHFSIWIKNHCRGFGCSLSSEDEAGKGSSGGKCR
jgi:hypothetical protein